MSEPRTAAERYLRDRLANPEYAAAHERARLRIGAVDRALRALDVRREELGLSKAAVARKAGLAPEAVRRLFASQGANPTLNTITAIAEALDMEFRPVPKNTPEQGQAA